MARIPTLPATSQEYNAENERVSRRSTEQFLQDAFVQIDNAQNKSDKTSSLSLRHFQFLLMGASNG